MGALPKNPLPELAIDVEDGDLGKSSIFDARFESGPASGLAFFAGESPLSRLLKVKVLLRGRLRFVLELFDSSAAGASKCPSLDVPLAVRWTCVLSLVVNGSVSGDRGAGVAFSFSHDRMNSDLTRGLRLRMPWRMFSGILRESCTES